MSKKNNIKDLLNEYEIVPLSQKGVEKAIEWADDYLSSRSVDLNTWYHTDAKRLYQDWLYETNPTRKKLKRGYFDNFCTFMKTENNVSINEESLL